MPPPLLLQALPAARSPRACWPSRASRWRPRLRWAILDRREVLAGGFVAASGLVLIGRASWRAAAQRRSNSSWTRSPTGSSTGSCSPRSRGRRATRTRRRRVGALVALGASFLASYVRARGASLGYGVEESPSTRGAPLRTRGGRALVRLAGVDGLGRAPPVGPCRRSSARARWRRRSGRERRRKRPTAPAGARVVRAKRITYGCYRAPSGSRGRCPSGARGSSFGDRRGRHSPSLPGIRGTVAANQAQVLGLPVDDPLVRASTAGGVRALRAVLVRHVPPARPHRREIVARMDATGLRAHPVPRSRQGKGGICAPAAPRELGRRGRVDRRRTGSRRRPSPRSCSRAGSSSCSCDTAQALGHGDPRPVAGRQGRAQARAAARREPAGGPRGRPRPDRPRRRGRDVRAQRARCRPDRRCCRSRPARRSSSAPVVPDAGRLADRVRRAPIAFEPTGDRRAGRRASSPAGWPRRFERAISAAPADWHVFQPGWEP